MGCPPPCEVPDPGGQERWVFAYGVQGDLRFISHHDTLRMFRRALARAGLPVRFTEGYNPHPKLSIPLPLSVGVASEDESIVVEFDRPIDGEAAAHELQRQMPSGIKIGGARLLAPGERMRPVLVRYRLDLGEDRPEDIEERVRQTLQSTAVTVTRVEPASGRSRTVDVRPYLEDMKLTGNGVEFTLRITGGGTARPAEVAGLLGFDVRAVNHRIRRMNVQWN